MEYIKYKDDLPENTINRIKKKLIDLDIHTTEQYYSCEDLVYSCRINIDAPS